MMSEKEVFRWNGDGKKEFKEIKRSIALAPTLVTPDFKKNFIIFYYASEHTMSDILTQKNDQGIESPIAFMSVPLKKNELKYSLIEKKAFSTVKAVKHFRYYILHSHYVVYVPETIVKSILTQQDVGLNKMATWVAKIQEYDIDIKKTKLVIGKDLCKLIVESTTIPPSCSFPLPTSLGT